MVTVFSASSPSTLSIFAELVTAPSVNAVSLNRTSTRSPPWMSGVTPVQQEPPGWLNSRKPVASMTPSPMPTCCPLRETVTVAVSPAWASYPSSATMSRLGKISMLPGPNGGLPAWAMPPRVTAAPVTVTAARPPASSRLGDRIVRDAGGTALCAPPRPPCWVGRVLVIAYSAVAPCPHVAGRSGDEGTLVRPRRPGQPRRGGAVPPNPGACRRRSRAPGRRVGRRCGRGDRDVGVAVPRLARPPLPAAAAAAAVAGAPRAALRHGREQRRLLPVARPRDLRRLARAHAAGLPLGGQGQPLPHPRQAAARARGAGGPPRAARRGPRRPARRRPAAAAAHAEGGRRPAARLPRLLPA